MKLKLLKNVMADKKVSRFMLAKECKINLWVLMLRLWGIGQFKLWEINSIAKCLSLSKSMVMAIFFDQKVS